MQDLEVFSAEVRANIILGMKLFFLLGPVYRLNKQMDASCCAILFCKALELQIKDCFAEGLKEALPECFINIMDFHRTSQLFFIKRFSRASFRLHSQT